MAKYKYNAIPIYWHPKYNIIVEDYLAKEVGGFLCFKSQWEFRVYKTLLSYTNSIVKDCPFKIGDLLIKPDFLLYVNVGSVNLANNSFLVIEAKGFETKEWKVKWNWFNHKYPYIHKRVIKTSKELNLLKIELNNYSFSSVPLDDLNI